MKNKDQILLEQAYLQVQQQLLEEGIIQDTYNKVKDKLLKLGKDFPQKFANVYGKIMANPNLYKVIKASAIVGPILFSLAQGSIAHAADLDVNDLINTIHDHSKNGTISTEDLQNIVSNYDHGSVTHAVGSADHSHAANTLADAGADVSKAGVHLDDRGVPVLTGFDGVNDVAGKRAIEDVLNRFDFQMKADYIRNKPPLEDIIKDIASEARYRKFDLEQVKQILKNVDTTNLAAQTKALLPKLINSIKI
jgi:hypothetical protein